MNNAYEVWVDSRRLETLQKVVADTSFSARVMVARKLGVSVVEVIAVKQSQ